MATTMSSQRTLYLLKKDESIVDGDAPKTLYANNKVNIIGNH
jgi:hypothetical protein